MKKELKVAAGGLTTVKHTLLCGVALASVLGASNVAYAADFLADARDWSGFYVGGHLGAVSIAGDYSITSSDLSATGGGAIAGLQAGVNFQMDAFVFGIEGDFSLGGAEVGFIPSAAASYDGFASIRGRLGMDLGGTMLYATAGGGWVGGTVYSSDVGDSFKFSEFVPVVGVGAEFFVTDKVSVKTEGLMTVSDFTMSDPDSESSSTDSIYTARVGVNIHF